MDDLMGQEESDHMEFDKALQFEEGVGKRKPS
jgi:hypothetical protein